ncbi:extracellular solute-binding protein [Methylobrevis albus]|uniref:Extracellular solute-binding protein n=1 Tax=Methylobrevis albus TaxID=2793297 RepID=A0A931MZ20_9HYPH|nr:extracellular solute-binding protein [Methylobrevis albus]MBH0237311.1 extracellular solute-binding protein [Methylobrevis albus]
MLPRTTFLTGAALALAAFTHGASAEEINALVWCDHTDPAFLEPFTQATGITVNVKEYEGTGTALSLVEQSQPGDWDVFVVDSTDVKRVAARGLLAELKPEDFPLADIPPAVQAPELHQVDGVWRAVPEKFGYNAVAYDKDQVDEAAMRKAHNLFDPAYQGKIAVYDYYLPQITQIAILLGKDPKTVTEADLPAIREKLFALKANAALVSDVVTSQTALATGEVGILVGGGEYAVSGLHAEKPNLDWVLPDEGGVRWQQAIGVFETSARKDAAVKFVQYVLSPEGQARLATSSCYWGMPANAAATLDDTQKQVLRWDEQPAFIANSHLYIAPSDELDQAMQSVWQEFLQH